MAQYTEALAALLAIEVQQTVPSKKVPEPSNQPTRNHDRPDEVCTARETVDSYTMAHGEDYEGRAHADVYITARLLAEVVGFSKETARRRLKYFEEQGVVKTTIDDGYRNYYELTDEFSALSDENIRSETEVADTAKKLLALAEEK
jgi:DNA-binding transcriptional ArsR family regulator